MVSARRKQALLVLGLLGALLMAAMLAGVAVGAVPMSGPELLRVLGTLFAARPDLSDTHRAIVLDLRLPRVFLAALVGASLALAGTVFQALFQNPMADPYVLGVSSGAAFGATLGFLIPARGLFLSFSPVPLCAFSGALSTVAVVSRLAAIGGAVSLPGMLLAGMAVGTFLSALVSLLLYLSRGHLEQVIFWLMGGFDRASWSYLLLGLPYFAVGLFVVLVNVRNLNALLLGEEEAGGIGVEVETVKKRLLVGASLLTAVSVAVSGPIGFVGLIVPHALRAIVGPDHRLLLPAAGLGGAMLLVGADILARTLMAPVELPVALLMALGGAPFFLHLLSRSRRPAG